MKRPPGPMGRSPLGPSLDLLGLTEATSNAGPPASPGGDCATTPPQAVTTSPVAIAPWARPQSRFGGATEVSLFTRVGPIQVLPPSVERKKKTSTFELAAVPLRLSSTSA